MIGLKRFSHVKPFFVRGFSFGSCLWPGTNSPVAIAMASHERKIMMRGCCSCLGIDTIIPHYILITTRIHKNYPPKIWKGIFCCGLGTLLLPTLFGLKPTGGQYFALQLLQHQSRPCPANLAFSFHCLAAQRRVDHGDNVDVSFVYIPED